MRDRIATFRLSRQYHAKGTQLEGIEAVAVAGPKGKILARVRCLAFVGQPCSKEPVIRQHRLIETSAMPRRSDMALSYGVEPSPTPKMPIAGLSTTVALPPRPAQR
ncbi:hypothetical protein [Alteraurantiacibacter aquimixticola]|uniref:hypothetical protein n=1 Tax=Alteraurantiacibacter aquimixticola TaxID=2489173 RepID=UPI0010A9D53B|nr:hypothetical protein [Alteraurantiacibacter aquimixticola]